MNKCIDVGREGCPCALAEAGSCLVCSKIGGGTCDDCSWQGSCIYTLYEQNGRRIIDQRREQLMNIREVRTYRPDFQVFVVEVDRGFCQRAQTAGAYVFVKNPEEDPWYGLPVSVLKSEPDKGLLHLGVCICGPKTTKLLTQTSQLSVRGIYYNGLSGLQTLMDEPEQTVVYGKGIALAPLRNLLDGGPRAAGRLKNLHLYADLDKVGYDFFRDYFGDLPVNAIEICDFTQIDFRKIDTSPRNNVFALSSPYYVEQIRGNFNENQPLVYPVYGNICCGEGICGACTHNDESGRTIRRCKTVK